MYSFSISPFNLYIAKVHKGKQKERKKKLTNLILKNTEKKKTAPHQNIVNYYLSRKNTSYASYRPAKELTARGKEKAVLFSPSVEANIGVLLMNSCAKR